MVMEGLQDDYGDGSMQCTYHPYKNNSPGGICAFCLQEKLGKLVSSSFPIAVFPSSSSSPSFRSDHFTPTTATSLVVPVRTNPSSNLSNTHNQNRHYNHFRKSKIPFLLTQKKKKNPASDHTNNIIYKRSKSSVSPRRGVHFMEANEIDDLSPHKRKFWSFLHLSKHPTTKNLPEMKEICYPSSSSSSSANICSFSQQTSRERTKEEFVVVEENESPDQVSFDRKVSRSRSVGCGSRSFSGDFFELISTGFGDCTLRRVESQRDGKSRVRHACGSSGGGGQGSIKERFKCGGLFSGFMITSSSSSSSSSYWVSSTAENNNNHDKVNAKPSAAEASVVARQLAHGRNKRWGWALASPIRAFKPSSGKRDPAAAANKNAAPNLAGIPSLLAVRN